MDNLSDAEIGLARDAFSLHDPGRKGVIGSEHVPRVVRSVGFSATSEEISVCFFTLEILTLLVVYQGVSKCRAAGHYELYWTMQKEGQCV